MHYKVTNLNDSTEVVVLDDDSENEQIGNSKAILNNNSESKSSLVTIFPNTTEINHDKCANKIKVLEDNVVCKQTQLNGIIDTEKIMNCKVIIEKLKPENEGNANHIKENIENIEICNNTGTSKQENTKKIEQSKRTKCSKKEFQSLKELEKLLENSVVDESLFREFESKVLPDKQHPEESKMNETIIEIDDDDDDCEELVCSQLYSSSFKENADKTGDITCDDMFSQVKKELEEMDRISINQENCSPLTMNPCDSDNEDWLKECFNIDISKSSNQSNENNSKTKKYTIPEIIEPHTFKSPAKRKSVEKKNDKVDPAKKARIMETKLKKMGKSKKEFKKKTEESVKNQEEIKWKLKEIAMNKPSTSNQRVVLGIESKPLAKANEPTASPSELLPTSKPIAAIPVHRQNIVPRISTDDIILNILRWQTCWLAETNSNFLPQLTKQNATKMLDKFRDYKEYYDNVMPLLTLEMWYSICRDYEAGSSRERIFNAYIKLFHKHFSSSYIEVDCERKLTIAARSH